MEVDVTGVKFQYRDHHDGKEKCMTLKPEHFLSRVLWHVPVKGQHNVRYYGLYVPGAKAKRAEVCEQLGERREEGNIITAKKERKCPDCGGILRHRSSVRRKISYIKNTNSPERANGLVQQVVQADRGKQGAGFPSYFGFFGLYDGRLT